MAVVNTWTIPTDPGFQTRRSDTALVREIDHTRPKPRIKPEAMMIAIKNQGSVAQLFNPYSKPPSFRSTSRSGTHEVKRNFIKENTKQIKTIQKSHRESESVSSAREPLKVLHKSDKYEHVESKVAQEVKGTPQAPRSTSKSVRRKHSRSGSPMRDRAGSARSVVPPEDKRSGSPMRDRPVSVRSVVPPEDKQSVPRLSIDVAKEKAKQTKVNHISKNIRHITSSPGPRRRAPSAVASEELERKRSEDEMKYKRGKVPS
ncbi:Hypothetical predicted protein [Paramuricea clavata]|uniref:Uncharacterized protein n=1 Tax=Paramuricea clavata TaxID=317549 RepID=A0A6S7G9D4_PARCT|nr:Hypothetical predicted protein [Paramuricea clavata]